MQILQIVLNYIVEEDRLLMQVHGESRTLRVWLARNYVQLLWNTLREIILTQSHSTLPLGDSDRMLMAELMHHRIAEKFDFSTPAFQRGTTTLNPWGVSNNETANGHAPALIPTIAQGQISTPALTHVLEDGGFLAYGIKVTWNHKDTPQQQARQLALLPREGEGVLFNLNPDFPHALAHLFIRACQGANWGLDLSFVNNPAAGNMVLSTDAPGNARPIILH